MDRSGISARSSSWSVRRVHNPCAAYSRCRDRTRRAAIAWAARWQGRRRQGCAAAVAANCFADSAQRRCWRDRAGRPARGRPGRRSAAQPGPEAGRRRVPAGRRGHSGSGCDRRHRRGAGLASPPAVPGRSAREPRSAAADSPAGPAHSPAEAVRSRLAVAAGDRQGWPAPEVARRRRPPALPQAPRPEPPAHPRVASGALRAGGCGIAVPRSGRSVAATGFPAAGCAFPHPHPPTARRPAGRAPASRRRPRRRPF